jgi:hypothetical protein
MMHQQNLPFEEDLVPNDPQVPGVLILSDLLLYYQIRHHVSQWNLWEVSLLQTEAQN